MTFFKNLFSCTLNTTENEKNADFRQTQKNTNEIQKNTNDDIKSDLVEIRNDVKSIKNDITFLYRVKADNEGNVKRIEDKINNNFAIVTSKIDNVIMILNNR